MAPLMDVETTNIGEAQSAKDISHDFTTLIGYTVPAADGGNIAMDDISLETPAFREVRQVKVHDIRNATEQFSLDENGFQFFKLAEIPGEGQVDFSNMDDPKIKEIHYKGMSEWLKKELGAKEVIVYNHIIRNGKWHPQKYSTTYRGPAMRPHVDISHAFAPKLFHGIWKALGRDEDEFDKILASGHWQTINLWRPLKTIKRDPLAVLDTRSAPSDHIFNTTHEREEGVLVETSWLASGLEPGDADDKSTHKWYYMHAQLPDEVLAFKLFDGRPEATSNGTPHTAVQIPGTEDEEARHSIEMRVMVLY